MERRGTQPPALLSSLLREVSRSFYLTLRVLPRQVRPQIGLAYLLARTADTIADTELVPLEQRLALLRAYRERILGLRQGSLELGGLARHQGTASEGALLDRYQEGLAVLDSFDLADRERVRAVLTTIIGGQELDLTRFQGAAADHLIALESDQDLDDYTYRVAGCVGEFWTRMCLAHLFRDLELRETDFLAKGVRFGKGLQLVNILRDLPNDLRQGRCYLPRQALNACGLQPDDLLSESNEPRLRKSYDSYLDMAADHLAAGWCYTNMIPRRFIRVRLACAWPLLIGRETLQLLRVGKILGTSRIKVDRRSVRRILWRSVAYYPWPGAWRGLFGHVQDVPSR
jgi:farnesyl-diphosphate farnesyltransferase